MNQPPLRRPPLPSLSRPPSAAVSSTSTGGAQAALSFIERLYDSVGLMRGNKYTPVVRGMFTAVVPTLLLYLAWPDVFINEETNELRLLSLSFPLALFLFGAFFV